MKNDYFYITDQRNDYSPATILSCPLRLPIEAKYLYVLMFGKMCSGLSDNAGRRYIVYKKSELIDELKESASNVDDYLISLEAAKLIETKEADAFYVKKMIFA